MANNWKLTWRGPEIVREVSPAVIRALREAGADLQQESSDQAPLELGDLRGNAGTDESRLHNEGIIAVGYNLPYSLVQHERMDFVHPMGGKAKYLEDPFNANKGKYMRHIADAVDEVTR